MTLCGKTEKREHCCRYTCTIAVCGGNVRENCNNYGDSTDNIKLVI